jgi:hypothetical protein
MAGVVSICTGWPEPRTMGTHIHCTTSPDLAAILDELKGRHEVRHWSAGEEWVASLVVARGHTYTLHTLQVPDVAGAPNVIKLYRAAVGAREPSRVVKCRDINAGAYLDMVCAELETRGAITKLVADKVRTNVRLANVNRPITFNGKSEEYAKWMDLYAGDMAALVGRGAAATAADIKRATLVRAPMASHQASAGRIQYPAAFESLRVALSAAP